MGLIITLVAVVAFLYFWYMALITRRNKAKEAFSTVDVQLKKRADLIPNILAIAKRYMQHEKDLLTEVTALRAQVVRDVNPGNPDDVKQYLAAANTLGGSMGKLMVAVENYPELKADQTMMQAQLSYNEVEAQIAAARRFYNSAVTSLNNAAQIFPGSLIASMANVETMPFYEAAEADRAPVNAAELLK
ncbi:LemA family protein [bacterium]|nr:LemA family protein [bacterium]